MCGGVVEPCDYFAPLFLSHLQQAIDDCLLPKLTGDERKRFLRNKDLLETLEVVGELLLDNV